jgi:transposase
MVAMTVGIDLAKSVFQVHGVDSSGRTMVRRRLSRGRLLDVFAQLPPCRIGMEACASAHHWARELVRLGHDVRLIPPQYVKPYVKRNKTDAADAEAICEAVSRPNMRFVPIKTVDQQAVLALHRARSLLVRQHAPRQRDPESAGGVWDRRAEGHPVPDRAARACRRHGSG